MSNTNTPEYEVQFDENIWVTPQGEEYGVMEIETGEDEDGEPIIQEVWFSAKDHSEWDIDAYTKALAEEGFTVTRVEGHDIYVTETK